MELVAQQAAAPAAVAHLLLALAFTALALMAALPYLLARRSSSAGPGAAAASATDHRPAAPALPSSPPRRHTAGHGKSQQQGRTEPVRQEHPHAPPAPATGMLLPLPPQIQTSASQPPPPPPLPAATAQPPALCCSAVASTEPLAAGGPMCQDAMRQHAATQDSGVPFSHKLHQSTTMPSPLPIPADDPATPSAPATGTVDTPTTIVASLSMVEHPESTKPDQQRSMPDPPTPAAAWADEHPGSPTGTYDRPTTASMPMLPSQLLSSTSLQEEEMSVARDLDVASLGRDASSLQCPSLSSIDTVHQLHTLSKTVATKASGARRLLATMSIGSEATSSSLSGLPRPGKVQRSMHKAASKAAAAVTGVLDGAKAAAAAALAKIGHKGSGDDSAHAGSSRGGAPMVPSVGSAPRVMVSGKDGDKRTSVFRANKVLPTPVFYAMVHPKPVPTTTPAVCAGKGLVDATVQGKGSAVTLPPLACKAPIPLGPVVKQEQQQQQQQSRLEVRRTVGGGQGSLPSPASETTPAPTSIGGRRHELAERLEPLQLLPSSTLGGVERLVSAGDHQTCAAAATAAAAAAGAAQSASASALLTEDLPPLQLFALPWQQLDIYADRAQASSGTCNVQAPADLPPGIDPATALALANLWASKQLEEEESAGSGTTTMVWPSLDKSGLWQADGTQSNILHPHRLTATGTNIWADRGQAGVWDPPDAGATGSAWGQKQGQEQGQDQKANSAPSTPQSLRLVLPDDLDSPDDKPWLAHAAAWPQPSTDCAELQQQHLQHLQHLQEGEGCSEQLVQLLAALEQHEHWVAASASNTTPGTHANTGMLTAEQLQALLTHHLFSATADQQQVQQQLQMEALAALQTQAMSAGAPAMLPDPVQQAAWSNAAHLTPQRLHVPPGASATQFAAGMAPPPCTPRGHLPPYPASPKQSQGRSASKGTPRQHRGREQPISMLAPSDFAWDASYSRGGLPGSPAPGTPAHGGGAVLSPGVMPGVYPTQAVCAPHPAVGGLQLPVMAPGLAHMAPQQLYLLPQGLAPAARQYVQHPLRSGATGMVLLPHGQVALVPRAGWAGPQPARSRYETGLTASVVQVKHAGAPPVLAVSALAAASPHAPHTGATTSTSINVTNTSTSRP